MRRVFFASCMVCELLVGAGDLDASGNFFRGAYLSGFFNWGRTFGTLDGGTVEANQLEHVGLKKLKGTGVSNTGIAFGYTGGYSNFCLGGQLELSVGLGEAKKSVGSGGAPLSGHMTMKPRFSVNLPFQFGLPVNRTFVYGEVGPVWAFRKASVNVRNAASNPISFSKRYQTVGFLVGVGLRQQVNKNFLTSIAYRYSKGSKKIKNTDLGDLKSTLSQQEVIVSLGYKF